MHVRIRIEQFIALLLGILGIAALFTVWFSRAILVFHLDEFAGGELDYIAQSAFQLAPAQFGLLLVGVLFLAAAVALLVVGVIRAARADGHSSLGASDPARADVHGVWKVDS